MSEPRTNQEVFDYVLAKLAKQGRPSVSWDGRCVFRGHNGERCAAGWLLPDDLWSEEINRKDFCSLKAIPRFRDDERIAALPYALVVDLQFAHDTARGDRWLEDWRRLMRDVAVKHGLQYHDPAGTPPRGEPTD